MERHVGPALRAGGAITPAGEPAELDRGADLIMDAIVEDLDRKGELLRGFAVARERGAIVHQHHQRPPDHGAGAPAAPARGSWRARTSGTLRT